MTLRVSGKNIDIGDSLRTYVDARLDLVFLKYAAEPTGGHVTIEREGSGFRTDCTLHLDIRVTLQAEGEASDAYSSFNKAADRIENRLRRQKDRSQVRVAQWRGRSRLRNGGATVWMPINAPAKRMSGRRQPGRHRRIHRRCRRNVRFGRGGKARCRRFAGRLLSSCRPIATLTWSIAAPTATSAGSISPLRQRKLSSL